MTLFKTGVVALIAAGFSLAAIVMGFRVSLRHSETYARNVQSVAEIWGGPTVQRAPTCERPGETTAAGLQAQSVTARIHKSVRTKGLLEFPGYRLELSATYTLKNFGDRPALCAFAFKLPSGAGSISGISVLLDGKEYAGDGNLTEGVDWQGELLPGQTRTVQVSYEAQGASRFTYELDSHREIRDLAITLETDFSDVGIPDGAMAASERRTQGGKTVFAWKAKNFVTRQNVALQFEIPPSGGELTSRMFFCAPLSIFLFLGFLLAFCAARRIRMHPVNYLFTAASFFIFYLLASYLVSYLPMALGIGISLAVSSAIAEYYLFLTGKGKALMAGAGAGIFVFEWCFSTAFFFPEHTGLLITIASIVAFLVLVTVTGRIDWEAEVRPPAGETKAAA